MENFRFPNFQNRPHLNLNGDAVGEVGELVLTQAQTHQVGAAWFDQPVRVDNGFVSQFGFSITEVENTGGEGFAFVLQSAGPYSIGNSDAGLGYDGLGSGLAIEFDTAQSAEMGDPATPHISVHSGLFGAKLSAKEPELAEKYSSPWEDLALYDETLENRLRARFITITYEPSDGILKVSLSHKSADRRYVHKDLLSTQIGAISGEYHVGFTAATGKSFARFALLSWAFECAGPGETQSQVRTFCSQDFDGPNCAVTNEVAERECPRRTACNVCTEDVYNCAWCSGGNDGDSGHCVVGTVENIRECSAVALEPLSCSAGLSHIWIYLLGVAFFVIIVFAFVLFRMLPMVQSFRAISLLVALVGGALSGMVLSYFISISLVEISETTFFGIAYGFFFSVQFILISAHLVKIEIPERGWCSAHVILLIICDVWVFLSAIACFLLDRRFIHWLPEAPKVLFYTVLGASLNFCLVFSIAEITDEVMHKCSERGGHGANIASTFDTRRGTRRSAVVSSQARVALLAAASMLSGTFFGFMFGTLRIEEESQYRVALALQQEAAYTYPVGALIGGVSALLYQLVQLPLASDEQIDRILRESGRDGL
ncbi:Lectin-related protein [Hondaea fermentalgiana]|uniref:Lectin-related protein n=1 Tax=Hondaea fermentalgiana TaxID=2315210 RepID=A0A2R5GV69_9STRA|nr:Lectin-related protein [Hondaea fermentalgiana]|eukprot:GBG31814.1 Lectin-related protein [Hondaea fermentalgiana]